jgi:hypothetical protein
MGDIFIQLASLVAHAVEDLSYLPLAAGRYTAALAGIDREPHYKPGGFFAFGSVPPGKYILRLSGEGLQARAIPVTLPLAAPFLELPCEDELLVLPLEVNVITRKLVFDTINLTHMIPAGAAVTAEGAASRLTQPLGPGSVIEARLADVNGFQVGTVVRIRRSTALRVRLNPYATFAEPVTVITGQVTAQASPEVGIPGAQVRLVRVNDKALASATTAGVRVWTVELDVNQKKLLGADFDVATQTDKFGYYSLYFPRAEFITGVTVAVTCDGYQPQVRSEPVPPDRRKEMSFRLVEA